MKRHTPDALLALARRYALQSKAAKRRGDLERAHQLLTLSRYCWHHASQDLNLNPPSSLPQEIKFPDQ